MRGKSAGAWPGVALTAVVAAVLAVGCSSGTSSPVPRPSDVAVLPAFTGSPPAAFVSLRTGVPDGEFEVALSSSTSGAIMRKLLPESRTGMSVTGLSLDGSGNLWITYSRGPTATSAVNGGDPKPHSCANEIVVWHAATGRFTVFLRTSDNLRISGGAVSPDGRLLAYTESGCATGFFNSYLRVADIASGRSWTIGRAIARCHLTTDPVWSADSRALIVGYAPPSAVHYTGPQGTCLQSQREELLVLNPAVSQPGLHGRTVSADKGCQINSAAGMAGGDELAVESCGGEGYYLGPARLLVFDPHLHLVRRITLGRCSGENELSADRSGTGVLVSVYLYCNPPGTPGPVTRLWRYTAGGRLQLITTVPGGDLGISLATW